MIWYVDIEHQQALADPLRAPDFDKVRAYRAHVCSETSGLPCQAVLYQDVSWALAQAHGLQAIVISGNTTDWEAYDWKTFDPLFDLVRSGKFPTIGVCGGHQLIGLMYGAHCDAIRRLEPGEQEQGGFAQGWYKEVGFLPINLLQDDPIFDGLNRPPIFYESHYWEIKDLPDEFELLASTDAVKIQCIRHKTMPIYATQFHPEASSPDHPDGFQLLHNFFKIAKAKLFAS